MTRKITAHFRINQLNRYRMETLHSRTFSTTGVFTMTALKTYLVKVGVLTFVGLGTSLHQTPTITLPDLSVRTVQSGLAMPTSIAFLGPNDFFVTEKNSGRVRRNNNGVVTTVLDLGVNFASERGLLGIALHPNFPFNPGVYLFWSCIGSAASSPFPAEIRCSDATMFSQDTDDAAFLSE